ncbi:RluA family pseudouridine synthase [Algicella marina]|uniref:Pseudouridine synthase n=1 Tax=Algicella marina TaxID=2683284 RepID=A0A6P1SVX1_9RHOB|nr:RluA family pseudouridine synthase [Algicella marina]QHQ33907.1 RluA family pseudouridine synthase [Algicella marina]
MTEPLLLTVPDGAPLRLDKALAAALPEGSVLSRSRLQALIAEGAVAGPEGVMLDAKAKVTAGTVFRVAVPEAREMALAGENIPLDIAYEDDELIVVNKPAGMVVHPAPGAETGTLVQALLHHCGDSLSGIGGARRPGIVHRIDKETSGLLVVAKTDAAHQGLAAQFAAHDVEREYLALCWGAPSPMDPRLAGLPGVSFEPGAVRIEGAIDRHRADRKRMAVVASGGRRAVTRVAVEEAFGSDEKPVAARVRCWLETGRTHQIRVHMAHVGHALVGDPVYGRPRAVARGALPEAAVAALRGFPRQALHAATLGFIHPETRERLRFSAGNPEDINLLLTALRAPMP